MYRSVLLLLCCGIVSAQAKSTSSPTELQVSSEKILNVSPFGFFGPAQSDAKGDVFIHVGSFEEVNILKVTLSSDTTVYRLHDAEQRKYSFYDYSVTPGGTVWALVNESGSPALSAIEFDSHGEMRSPVLLALPDAAEANRFVALDSSVLLLAGHYTEEAPQKLRGRPFLGIFDAARSHLKILDSGAPQFRVTKIDGGSVPEGGCAPGDNGNAYFLTDDSITVLSPAGEVIKHIHFSKAAPDWLPAGIRVSGGRAALRFEKQRPDHTLEARFLVIELNRGEAMGRYEPPHDVGVGPDISFSPNEGFSFISDEHGSIKIVRAQLR